MKRTYSFWLKFFLAIIFGIIGFVYFSSHFPDVISGIENISIAYSFLLLIFLCAIAISNRNSLNPSQLIYGILFWSVLSIILLSAYSYRFEIAQFGFKLSSELNPSRPIIKSSGSVAIRSNLSGQFVLEAMVSKAGQMYPVQFLIDTGASDVILSPKVASRLGFDMKALKFNKPYHTANGVVLGAPVRIRRIDIGTLSVEDIRASVNGSEMGLSLLGMSFLERLSGFEVQRNTLTLKP